MSKSFRVVGIINYGSKKKKGKEGPNPKDPRPITNSIDIACLIEAGDINGAIQKCNKKFDRFIEIVEVPPQRVAAVKQGLKETFFSRRHNKRGGKQ